MYNVELIVRSLTVTSRSGHTSDRHTDKQPIIYSTGSSIVPSTGGLSCGWRNFAILTCQFGVLLAFDAKLRNAFDKLCKRAGIVT